MSDWPCRDVPVPVELGRRAAGAGWAVRDFTTTDPGLVLEPLTGGGVRLVLETPGAAAVSVAFAVPRGFQAFGGGERFDQLDLCGQSVRYYLENFGLVGGGSYLPSPWVATTLGWGLFLPDEAPAMLHIAAPHDPDRIVVQVEGPRLEMEIHPGGLMDLYTRLIGRIGPPALPPPSFYSLWKAGDWRIENHATVAADEVGFAAMDLPLGVKLLDAYWSDEVHSFRFDPAKHPQAQEMLDRLRSSGAEVHLWLCPWVVVGTASHRMAVEKGWVIKDAAGNLLTRRPGANPNVVAALIDYSNPEAARWWADSLRGLRAMGIAGFKADFGEQLPENALLHSGETGGRAHNAFVRHYLQATIDAFDGETANIISRSGSPRIRTPVWTGDQTSDFCPKTGLPAAIRAVQSAGYSGWSFAGTDIGGYFGTPTPQVFARWVQFAAFTPLFMLHGLGCREPWDMDGASLRLFVRYARLHLALAPEFERLGRIAAEGGPPVIRMMPLAFPDTDWRGRNDWDQQFLLGEDLLVAPVAFYGNTRAVWVPEGAWYDVLGGGFVQGPALVVRDVPQDRIPLFLRKGGRLRLRAASGQEIWLSAGEAAPDPALWTAVLGAADETEEGPCAADLAQWFGRAAGWLAPSGTAEGG